MAKHRYYIDPNKVYSYPEEVSVVRHAGKILVIAPLTANWIVLNDESQLNAFYELGEKSISKVLNSRVYNVEDVREVVTQLEARRFCTKTVVSAPDQFRTMHVYLTNKCNLRCPHCYMFSGKANDNELATGEVQKLCEEYKKHGGVRVSFSGGEPLMRKDLPDIVEFAAKVGLLVRIYSNGSLWNESLVAKLARHIDSVQISIDGFSEESNMTIRGKGHFSDALNTIDLLVKYGVNTAVAVTPPYALLEKDMDRYISFVNELTEKYNGHNFVIKFSESLLNGRDICPTKADNQNYLQLINTLRRRIQGERYDIISFVKSFEQGVILDNCMFGSLNVASNGDVFYCARVSDLKPCANIRNTSFVEIMRIMKKAEDETKISKLKPCDKCNIRYICGGGCRIDAFEGITDIVNFDNQKCVSIKLRECLQTHKDFFYSLMIRSNKYFYKELEQ